MKVNIVLFYYWVHIQVGFSGESEMSPSIWLCLVLRHMLSYCFQDGESLWVVHGACVSGPWRAYDLSGKIRQKQEKQLLQKSV